MACERAEIIFCVTHTPNQLINKKRFINIHTLLQTRPLSKLVNVRGNPDLKSPGIRCPRDLELNQCWKRSPMNISRTCCKQHFCWQHQESGRMPAPKHKDRSGGMAPLQRPNRNEIIETRVRLSRFKKN